MNTPVDSTKPPSGDPEHPHRYTAALANLLEPQWHAKWEAERTFAVANPGTPTFDAGKPKFFCMDMFPYPSGAGLHVGHPEGYTATDIICRYKRHRGFNVLHPMGWDAFGLPAEQYAIQTGVHPAITTRKAIDTFRRQLKRFGFSYDWSREFATIDPDYYKWTQWIFLRIYDAWYDAALGKARPISELVSDFETSARPACINPQAAEFSIERKAQDFGDWKSLSESDRRTIIDSYRLAYIAEQTVNWCPKLGTALANEEVIDGRSERGDFPVFRKPLRQWMFRITAYADRLLNDLSLVKWPESTRTQQSEWIGRSEGAEVDFPVASRSSAAPGGHAIRVFTTRPDTIFGATFMVVAPEHPLVSRVLASPESETDVVKLRAYIEAARNKSDVDRQADTKDKTGVFTGAYAINPATNSRIPVWTADYVLMGYGHGAIMAVPGHDERDHEFASKFQLPIVEVVRSANISSSERCDVRERAFVGEGAGVNSANAEVSLNGLPTAEAKSTIIDWLERTKRGTRKINYKLRDWLFSRQRYWGEPFPIVFDAEGNHYPIGEKSLPLTLPDMADYQPIESDDPQPLLAKATDWINTTAGAAGVDPKLLSPDTAVRREANTMPGWAGSCWYYLRYCDPKNASRFVSREAEQYWMVSAKGDGSPHAGGVDLYIGGNEHAVLHLLYARFWHKVLFDLGEVSTPEPFGRLFHQGMILSFAYQRADKSLVAIDAVGQIEWDGEHVRAYRAATLDSDIEVLADESLTLTTATLTRFQSAIRNGTKRNDEGVPVLAEAVNVHFELADGRLVEQIVAKMSKSLKNVQNPDDVIEQYGADTFRLYEMYMGPLDASKPWNPRDIAGCFRFLQRFWRNFVDESTGRLRARFLTADQIANDDALLQACVAEGFVMEGISLDPIRKWASEKSVRLFHQTLESVTKMIESLQFNTAIAKIIEMNNELVTAGAGIRIFRRDLAEHLIVMLSPFAPHMAEELWSKFGFGPTIAFAPWPAVDESLLRDDTIEMPVQISGKMRGKITVPADADAKAIEALALKDEKVAQMIEGKTVRKVIVVPGKIINIVAS